MDPEELRRRAIDGLDPEIVLFGGSSEGGSVLRPPGIVASVCPATPERSIFNSVFASGPEALAASYDELVVAYSREGVRAWTVWVRAEDRASAALLAERGHVLDGSPRVMALELADLRPPERQLPDEVELRAATPEEVGRINDAAYGFEAGGWADAVTSFPTEVRTSATMAVADGEPVSCAVAIDSGDDSCISAVATLPEHQGRGLAGAIMTELLLEARKRGMRTGSLQASKAGAPVYERLGFADLGHVEMWERREG